MPLTKWQPPTSRHEVAEDGRVTWLELFFDLVFVAALIQLGDRLADNVTWRGGVAFAAGFVLLWWVWTGTTAYTNRFAVDDVTHRVLTFLQMFAVGNLAITAASTVDHWMTYIPLVYVLARVPTLLMYWRARSRVPDGRAIIDLYLGFFSAGLVLWLLSLAVPESIRPAVWALAVGVEMIAPFVGARKGYGPRVHDEHFEERYALFTIIVLGETFVKTLTEASSLVSELGYSTTTQLLGVLAFIILIAIWWTYFDDVAGGAVRETSPLTSWAPGNRLIWIYVHLPLAIGITAFGVAAKKVIGVEDLSDALKGSYAWMLVLALIFVLVSVAVLDLVTSSPHYSVDTQARVWPRLIAAAVLVPVGFLVASGGVSASIGVGLIAAVMVGQIGAEVVWAQKNEAKLNRQVAEDIHRQSGECDHLHAAVPPGPVPPVVCEPCSEKGVDWVQVRWCLVCGEVGCCDDSEGLHARAHYEETGHPVIATIEPGGDWAYCYIHDTSAPEWWEGHRATNPT